MVEIEGDEFIFRADTDEISMSKRMEAVKQTYHNVYDQARRELE